MWSIVEEDRKQKWHCQSLFKLEIPYLAQRRVSPLDCNDDSFLKALPLCSFEETASSLSKEIVEIALPWQISDTTIFDDNNAIYLWPAFYLFVYCLIEPDVCAICASLWLFFDSRSSSILHILKFMRKYDYASNYALISSLTEAPASLRTCLRCRDWDGSLLSWQMTQGWVGELCRYICVSV